MTSATKNFVNLDSWSNTSSSTSSSPPSEVMETLDDLFLSSVPTNSSQIESSKFVQESIKKTYWVILQNVPPSPDRTSALRKLRQSNMYANSGIIHQGRY